jgi:hypothetical protein
VQATAATDGTAIETGGSTTGGGTTDGGGANEDDARDGDDSDGPSGDGGDPSGDGGGPSGDGGGPDGGDGGNDDGTTNCTDDGETICNGRVIGLIDITENDDESAAVIQVDTTIYEVAEEEIFAGSFLVLEIDDEEVTLAFGDDLITLQEGDRVLK